MALAVVTVIKLLAALSPFQGDGYHGVSWARSLFICGVVDVVVVVVVDVAVRRPLVT